MPVFVKCVLQHLKMHMTLLMVAGHWLGKCYITSFSIQGIWGWFQKASYVNTENVMPRSWTIHLRILGYWTTTTFLQRGSCSFQPSSNLSRGSTAGCPCIYNHRVKAYNARIARVIAQSDSTVASQYKYSYSDSHNNMMSATALYKEVRLVPGFWNVDSATRNRIFQSESNGIKSYSRI